MLYSTFSLPSMCLRVCLRVCVYEYVQQTTCFVSMFAVQFSSKMMSQWPAAAVVAITLVLTTTIRSATAVKCYDCSYPLGNCSQTCEGAICVNATTMLEGKTQYLHVISCSPSSNADYPCAVVTR